MLAVAALLAVACIAGLIVYKKQFRLTRDKLDAARARWEAAGLRDYDLAITVTGGTSGEYWIQVRGGRLVEGHFNGRPFERPEQARPWTVPELFNVLEADLGRDAEPGSPAVFTRVDFDPADGHLVRYLRKQLGGSRHTIEIRTRLTAANR